MINVNFFLFLGFHSANLILIIFYLYSGSIFGYLLYGDSSTQPQITRDFIIPNRGFEFSYLFGNIFGVILIMIFYKIKTI